MKVFHDSSVEAKNGFIMVASRDRLYYELSLISLQSLKDYYPDSHVTLFTHESFVDDRALAFDTVITGIPIHKRAKMWCMARTPYQKTIYIDVDCLIRHKDVRKMHDMLDDCDMFFGTHITYTTTSIRWSYIDILRQIPIEYHGSMCAYNKTDLTIDFMQTWFDEYIKQACTPWEYGDQHYKEWQHFDMFTLWRMTSKRFPEFKRFNDLKIKLVERRYNNSIQDKPEDAGKKPVITQIDRSTWMSMPAAWSVIEKGLKDERHTVKKSPVDQAFIEYD